MSSAGPHESSSTTWFVGASFGHTDDQSARFLGEGIWDISCPSQKEQALVRSMRLGERIAIKAAYVRKRGLPFDNRQQTVSVMGIKAIGVIIENPQDGERVKVQWQDGYKSGKSLMSVPIRRWGWPSTQLSSIKTRINTACLVSIAVDS